MPRVDIWDVQAAKTAPAIDCGFSRDLEAHFEWGRVLGKGGFGLVRWVRLGWQWQEGWRRVGGGAASSALEADRIASPFLPHLTGR